MPSLNDAISFPEASLSVAVNGLRASLVLPIHRPSASTDIALSWVVLHVLRRASSTRRNASSAAGAESGSTSVHISSFSAVFRETDSKVSAPPPLSEGAPVPS